MAREKLGNRVIKLGDDDVREGGRPVPNAGTHFVKFVKKDTKIKAAKGDSDSAAVLELHTVITKGKDKGKRIVDNIGDGPSSTWKVGQLCYALGLSKAQAKGMTLVKLMKLCEKVGEWRINGRIKKSEEFGKQFKVTTHLPLKGGADAGADNDDDDDDDDEDEDEDAEDDGVLVTVDDEDDEDDEDEEDEEDSDSDDEDEDDEDDEEDEDEDAEDDDDSDEDEEDEDDDEDEEDDSDDEDDDDDDEEEVAPKRAAKSKPAAKKGGRKTASKKK